MTLPSINIELPLHPKLHYYVFLGLCTRFVINFLHDLKLELNILSAIAIYMYLFDAFLLLHEAESMPSVHDKKTAYHIFNSYKYHNIHLQ